jgi:hypothetical protein
MVWLLSDLNTNCENMAFEWIAITHYSYISHAALEEHQVESRSVCGTSLVMRSTASSPNRSILHVCFCAWPLWMAGQHQSERLA